jgi:histidinol-phosphate aminotransferase
MIDIRKSIKELKEYKVIQDYSVVKLNQNESPYDIPLDLKKEIINRMIKIQWNRYPPINASNLLKEISTFTSYPASGIIVANGSNEIIQAIFQTICEKGNKISIISPGFIIYERLARIHELEIVDIPLLQDFRFDVSSIIEKSKRTKMLIFSSPNNPTGTALSIEEINEILINYKGMVVVDEAYFDFYKETSQRLLQNFDNLIVIRTFSKAFGLAGLRLGYILTNPRIASLINKVKLPFSVGLFQQIAGELILRNKIYNEETVAKIIKERDKIFLELKKISGINPIPSFTNFILFELITKSAKSIFSILYERGVLLRYFTHPRLKNKLRVTVGTPKENEIFLKKLKDILLSKEKQ